MELTVVKPVSAKSVNAVLEPPADRSYRVVTPKKDFLEEHGFGRIKRVPYIVDMQPRVHRAASRYLIDVALGKWVDYKLPNRLASGKRKSPKTLRTYGSKLISFLEWADRRGVSLEACDYYEHVRGRYQQELQAGTWSRFGRACKPGTINGYVERACDFLKWMTYKGLRPEFHVPLKSIHKRLSNSGTDASAHRGVEILVREGALYVPTPRLRMPTDGSLTRWLESVYERHGITGGLVSKSVLFGALRRAEVVGFRVDTLPLNPADWHITNQSAPEDEQEVLIRVTYGTKGTPTGEDHGDAIGPPRHIKIPLHFAHELHWYRNEIRPKLLAKWVSAVRGSAKQKERLKDAVHLFFDEKTGAPITYYQVYKFWTKAELPYSGWRPHLGRHWWACSVLLREVRLHEEIARMQGRPPVALFAAAATDIIRLVIQPQLGHKNIKTCFIYLQWVADELGVALPAKWQQHLDKLAERSKQEDCVQ
jgi:integrase